MTDLNGQLQGIGKLLQLNLPETNAVSVTAPAIGRNQQAMCPWIKGISHFLSPAPNTFHGEFRSIMIDSDTDPTLIGGNIVNTVWSHLA